MLNSLILHCCLVTKMCLSLCDPMDSSPPGSSVHGISQAGIWSGLPFHSPGNFPDPGMEPVSLVSCIGLRILYQWATREALICITALLWRCSYFHTKLYFRGHVPTGEFRERAVFISDSLELRLNYNPSSNAWTQIG